ncbi:unnamed protein product [Haemonchus placei]|uniref:Uncharacterized protein n=1 Tax=Haemonchus placei TaxID=6290 RepID=A0A0N4WPN5_HAEPC|nr:unnamed protein product [Haemonchus placei]
MPNTLSMSKSSSSSTLGGSAQLSDTLPVKDEAVTGLSQPGLDDIQDDAHLNGGRQARSRRHDICPSASLELQLCYGDVAHSNINEGNAVFTEKLLLLINLQSSS